MNSYTCFIKFLIIFFVTGTKIDCDDDKISPPNIRFSSSVKAPIRTHDRTVLQMIESEQTGKSVMGMKGVSPLLGFRYVDIIQSLPIDDLHCCYIGVNNLMLDFFFDSHYHKERFFLGRKKSDVDKILLNVKPPRNFARTPRSVVERKYWKGNEHRSWLFYYMNLCLENVLPARFLNHYKLFADAVYILSKSTVTFSEIDLADSMLKQFVDQFENFYPPVKLVYNIHCLTHLAYSVKQTGPLWATTTFNFESNNGILMNFVHGTKDVVKQIYTKYSLSKCLEVETIEKNVVEYNETIDTKNRCSNFLKISDNVTLLGKGKNFDWKLANVPVWYDRVNWNEYTKIIYNKEIFVCHSESRLQYNDSCIKLNNNKYAQLFSILSDGSNVILKIKILNILSNNDSYKEKSFKTENHFTYIDVKHVNEKCVFIESKTSKYLREIPNKFQKY